MITAPVVGRRPTYSSSVATAVEKPSAVASAAIWRARSSVVPRFEP